MNSYIFITTEGYTYQPASESIEPDIENCQVVGFSEGHTPEEAFDNLICENEHLLGTTFNEVICHELRYRDFNKRAKNFHLV
jgi:hypothetical protein